MCTWRQKPWGLHTSQVACPFPLSFETSGSKDDVSTPWPCLQCISPAPTTLASPRQAPPHSTLNSRHSECPPEHSLHLPECSSSCSSETAPHPPSHPACYPLRPQLQCPTSLVPAILPRAPLRENSNFDPKTFILGLFSKTKLWDSCTDLPIKLLNWE